MRHGNSLRSAPAVDIEMRLIPMSGMPVHTGLSNQGQPLEESQTAPLEAASGDSSADSRSDQVQTIWSPYWNRFRVMAACMTLLANGMNDAAVGALIASIEKL